MGHYHAPVVRVPSSNGANVTVIGTISTKGKYPYRLMKGYLDSDGFIDYIKSIEDTLTFPHFWVVDNNRCHISKETQIYLQDEKVKLITIPPYSPRLNGIELFWGVAKRKWRKKLTQRKENDEEQDNWALTRESLDEITDETAGKCAAKGIACLREFGQT